MTSGEGSAAQDMNGRPLNMECFMPSGTSIGHTVGLTFGSIYPVQFGIGLNNKPCLLYHFIFQKSSAKLHLLFATNIST